MAYISGWGPGCDLNMPKTLLGIREYRGGFVTVYEKEGGREFRNVRSITQHSPADGAQTITVEFLQDTDAPRQFIETVVDKGKENVRPETH